jgi:uncharacterized protein involved in tellurium resistance
MSLSEINHLCVVEIKRILVFAAVPHKNSHWHTHVKNLILMRIPRSERVRERWKEKKISRSEMRRDLYS